MEQSEIERKAYERAIRVIEQSAWMVVEQCKRDNPAGIVPVQDATNYALKVIRGWITPSP